MTRDPRELWTPGAKQGSTPTHSISLEELIGQFIQGMNTIEVTAIWLFNERLAQIDDLLKEIQDMKEDIAHWNQTKIKFEEERPTI